MEHLVHQVKTQVQLISCMMQSPHDNKMHVRKFACTYMHEELVHACMITTEKIIRYMHAVLLRSTPH